MYIYLISRIHRSRKESHNNGHVISKVTGVTAISLNKIVYSQTLSNENVADNAVLHD